MAPPCAAAPGSVASAARGNFRQPLDARRPAADHRAMTDAALHLAPGPAAPRRPDDPRHRPPALRRGARPADHLPARARAAGVDRRGHPVRRSDVAADLPGPLRHPAAARQRRRRWRASASAAAPLTPDGSRAAWRLLCTHWDAFRGTPSRFWLESELAEIFGVTVRPSAATADAIYDQVAATLRRPDFRPRALLDRFGIRCWPPPTTPATTWPTTRPSRDDPTVADPGAARPSAPTATWSRPAPTGVELVDALGAAADIDTADYKGFIAALEDRRRTSWRTAPSPPTTATPTPAPRRSTTPRPNGSTARPAPARRPRTRPRAAPPLCWRWPGCRSRTAW